MPTRRAGLRVSVAATPSRRDRMPMTQRRVSVARQRAVSVECRGGGQCGYRQRPALPGDVDDSSLPHWATIRGEEVHALCSRVSCANRRRGGIMADMEEASPATLLDQLASLDPQERREVATIVLGLSETFAEVPDGNA